MLLKKVRFLPLIALTIIFLSSCGGVRGGNEASIAEFRTLLEKHDLEQASLSQFKSASLPSATPRASISLKFTNQVIPDQVLTLDSGTKNIPSDIARDGQSLITKSLSNFQPEVLLGVMCQMEGMFSDNECTSITNECLDAIYQLDLSKVKEELETQLNGCNIQSIEFVECFESMNDIIFALSQHASCNSDLQELAKLVFEEVGTDLEELQKKLESCTASFAKSCEFDELGGQLPVGGDIQLAKELSSKLQEVADCMQRFDINLDQDTNEVTISDNCADEDIMYLKTVSRCSLAGCMKAENLNEARQSETQCKATNRPALAKIDKRCSNAVLGPELDIQVSPQGN